MNFYLSFLNLIDAIVQPLIKLCKIAVISCVLSIALIVSTSIFFRYVLNNSITWSEEIAKYLMVWMVFVGAPVAMVQSRHIAIEMFPNLFRPRIRALIFLIVNLLIVLTMAFWTYRGFTYTVGGMSQVMSSFDKIPLGVVFASIPFGSCIMMIISFQISLNQILVIIDPEKYEDRKIKTVEEKASE
jgi:TRAP-type C4-dicarboxylate transport system permease small subunit|tara:strand:+ start:22 stop:579 length:558 start_codon:yes stop_codon:yes gene_type:complete